VSPSHVEDNPDAEMSVDQILENVDPDIRRLAQGVRKVIRHASPEMQEFVKRGAPTYEVLGKKAACIMIYRDHVNLGLFQGAKMKFERLEGTGKGLRRVKIHYWKTSTKKSSRDCSGKPWNSQSEMGPVNKYERPR
jgi:hypothetical protein